MYLLHKQETELEEVFVIWDVLIQNFNKVTVSLNFNETAG